MLKNDWDKRSKREALSSSGLQHLGTIGWENAAFQRLPAFRTPERGVGGGARVTGYLEGRGWWRLQRWSWQVYPGASGDLNVSVGEGGCRGLALFTADLIGHSPPLLHTGIGVDRVWPLAGRGGRSPIVRRCAALSTPWMQAWRKGFMAQLHHRGP